MSMREKVAELERRKAEALRMGGEERLRRQRERGKLDARTRLAKVLDPASFVEIGLLATHLGWSPADWQQWLTGVLDRELFGSRPV